MKFAKRAERGSNEEDENTVCAEPDRENAYRESEDGIV
jgi:hypothetical protein